METRDSTTSNADKHHRKERQTIGLTVVQTIGEFGHFCTKLAQHDNHNTDTHKEQHTAENRVEASDEFIYREHGGKGVITEDNQYPYYRDKMPLVGHGA